MDTITEILQRLTPHAILVGSASRGDEFNDLDFVVNEKGLKIAKEMLPNWDSIFIGHVKTFDTVTPIEVFRHWYGPDYDSLRRKKLQKKTLFGVELRCWPDDPQ